MYQDYKKFEKMQIPQKSGVLKFSRKVNLIFVFIIILFIITILVLNAVLLEPLYFMGVQIIYSIQSSIQSKFFQVLMNILSLICNTPIVGLVFALQMGIAKHKFKAIIHLSFFLIGFYFIAIFKQAYQQSRPIWTSNQINRYQWFCPTDFGNPSGHSYVPFPMFQPIIAKFIGFQNLKVAWVFLVFFGILVPFSRMYLGVHSLNQVFFGLSFGIAWTVLYRFGLRQLFYKTYSRIYKLKRVSHLLIIIFLHIIITIIPIIIFNIRLSTPMAEKDISNLNRICGSSRTSQSIQQSMFLICVLQSAVFGIIYGLFALPLKHQNTEYFVGNWKHRTYATVILHCLAMIVITGVAPLFGLVILPLFLKEPYSRFVILNICLTIGGFMFIRLVPVIIQKFQWINYQVNTYPITHREEEIKSDMPLDFIQLKKSQNN